MQPVRRDLSFPIDKQNILDWHPAGRQVGLFMNCMSILFPVGERFFISSVRNYQEDITDPRLREAVRAFIGQEAMHGREHEIYNAALQEAGIPAEKMEAEVKSLLDFFRRHTPRAVQLSGTVALEHFTAILAHQALDDARVVGGSKDPAMSAMWRWHALEETEHKAVAFDVYRAVEGSGLRAEAIRYAGQVLATVVLFSKLGEMYLRALRADPETKPLGSLRGWRQLGGFLLGRSPGVFRRAFFDYLDYFRPGFHPWDHDNRAFLKEMDDFVAQVDQLARAA
ncbi:metal-dependent hydrolase [Algiphilus sp.]|uniref:metal-dependent hydrolase n=1 Tax=Algiphilus sp. TaxID=1872431 RepID=UPI003B52C9AC